MYALSILAGNFVVFCGHAIQAFFLFEIERIVQAFVFHKVHFLIRFHVVLDVRLQLLDLLWSNAIILHRPQ